MSETKHLVLKIHPADNVLVALIDLKKGTEVTFEGNNYTLLEDIAAKHKFFTTPLKKGETIIMYGITVGRIKDAEVQVGQLMSTDNTVHQADPYTFRNFQYQWNAPDTSKYQNKTFNGYHRADGKVGTANYWLFIPTVFCENRNLDIIKASLHEALGYAIDNKYKSYTTNLVQQIQAGKGLEIEEIPFGENQTSKRVFKNIDGIKFLNHNGGCGGTRQDAATLSKLLAAYADHANVAGITLLSLGCQHLQIDDFKKDLLERNPTFNKPLIIFEQQSTKSEEALIKDAIKETLQHLVEANKIERAPAPLSKLNIGVKCGGSDGFSGISAYGLNDLSRWGSTRIYDGLNNAVNARLTVALPGDDEVIEFAEAFDDIRTSTSGTTTDIGIPNTHHHAIVVDGHVIIVRRTTDMCTRETRCNLRQGSGAFVTGRDRRIRIVF